MAISKVTGRKSGLQYRRSWCPRYQSGSPFRIFLKILAPFVQAKNIGDHGKVFSHLWPGLTVPLQSHRVCNPNHSHGSVGPMAYKDIPNRTPSPMRLHSPPSMYSNDLSHEDIPVVVDSSRVSIQEPVFAPSGSDTRSVAFPNFQSSFQRSGGQSSTASPCSICSTSILAFHSSLNEI